MEQSSWKTFKKKTVNLMNPRSVTFRAGRSASLLVEQVGISSRFSVGAKAQPAFTRDGREVKLYSFKTGEVT